MIRQTIHLLIPIFIFIQIACSSKAPPPATIGLAANRQMAVGVKSLQGVAANVFEFSNYFSRLAQKGIVATYGSKVSDIHLEAKGPLETPENLFQMGKLQVDDLFVIDATIKGQLEIPTAEAAATSEGATPPLETPSAEPELTDNYVEFNLSIFNGSNLRAVNIASFKVPTKPSSQFEMAFAEEFKKATNRIFPNPNIYPRNDPKYFANLLFVYSESLEKDSNTPVTCENAPERLKYYKVAKELFDIAVTKNSSRGVGGQGEAHQLTTRQNESGAKAKILDDCLADQSKSFEVQFEYGTLNAENQAFIQRAIASAPFDAVLKQYTSKPVKFRFQVEKDGSLSLFVDLRFDGDKYRAWTINRIPSRVKNFQILSLDPYYALMQKLVLFKTSLPAEAPFALKTSFENMKMMLNLKTLINGEVSFAVDGKLIKDQKRLSMAYPNKIFISVPGTDLRTIANRSPEIFQEKGWIALGNCKTIEGTKTEDGLAYDFFGFLCQ